MKKLMILSAAILAFSATPVLADNHGKGDKGERFQKHDTNGDGVISKSEFLSHAEERFSKMDADGSGDISKDEAKAAHEKKREMMKERQERREERQDSASE